MDSDQFDLLTARLGAHLTRRRSVGVIGVLGAASLGLAHDAAARKKKRKKGKGGKKKPKPSTTQPPTTPSGPSCTDGIKNRDETDVDCGGSCPRCAAGKTCQTRDDCISAICQGPPSSKTCQTCTPGTQCNFGGGGVCVCDQTMDGRIVCDMGDGGTPVDSCDECPVGTNCVATPWETLMCYSQCSLA